MTMNVINNKLKHVIQNYNPIDHYVIRCEIPSCAKSYFLEAEFSVLKIILHGTAIY